MAMDCDRLGDAYKTLGAVMRGRENCSALRKGHLLHLARKWGYVSHLWCGSHAARRAAALHCAHAHLRAALTVPPTAPFAGGCAATRA